MAEENPYQAPQADGPPAAMARASTRAEDGRFFAMMLSAVLLLVGQYIPFQRGALETYFLLVAGLGAPGLLNPRWRHRLLAVGLLLFAAYSFLAWDVLLFYQEKHRALEQQRQLDVSPQRQVTPSE